MPDRVKGDRKKASDLKVNKDEMRERITGPFGGRCFKGGTIGHVAAEEPSPSRSTKKKDGGERYAESESGQKGGSAAAPLKGGGPATRR